MRWKEFGFAIIKLPRLEAGFTMELSYSFYKWHPYLITNFLKKFAATQSHGFYQIPYTTHCAEGTYTVKLFHLS